MLLKVLYPEGHEVEVLRTIAYVGQAGETCDEREGNLVDDDGTESDVIHRIDQVVAVLSDEVVAETNSKPSKLLATPSARRVAKENGIDLKAIRGSGPNGRIERQDVISACESQAANESLKAGTNEKPNAEGAITASPKVEATETDEVEEFSRIRNTDCGSTNA